MTGILPGRHNFVVGSVFLIGEMVKGNRGQTTSMVEQVQRGGERGAYFLPLLLAQLQAAKKKLDIFSRPLGRDFFGLRRHIKKLGGRKLN